MLVEVCHFIGLQRSQNSLNESLNVRYTKGHCSVTATLTTPINSKSTQRYLAVHSYVMSGQRTVPQVLERWPRTLCICRVRTLHPSKKDALVSVIYIYIYICVCVCVCMCVYEYIYIYIYIVV